VGKLTECGRISTIERVTLRLELTDTVESSLLAQAQERGLSLEKYAEKVLEERSAAASTSAPKKKSLLELFAPIRGLDVGIGRNPSSGRSINL
jgi:hypothetical protein